MLACADKGRLPLHREPVPLARLVREIANRFAARAAEQQVELAVTAEDVTVRADPQRLRQALVNLLDNALRTPPPAG